LTVLLFSDSIKVRAIKQALKALMEVVNGQETGHVSRMDISSDRLSYARGVVVVSGVHELRARKTSELSVA